MTLTLAIAINVLLDVAMLATLAYVMSRSTKLNPHQSSVGPASVRLTAVRQPTQARASHAAVRLQPVLD